MNTIIICVGISGSGKSTWSTNLIKNDDTFLRINRDDIRKVLVGNLDEYYARKDFNILEKIINDLEIDIASKIVTQYKNIIIDNTHLRREYIDKWVDLFSDNNFFNHRNYTIKFKFFDCDLLEAKNRVVKRDNYSLSFDKNHVYICPQTDYIDKQYQQYQSIKKWILETYPGIIIT